VDGKGSKGKLEESTFKEMIKEGRGFAIIC
jgi:hypothetical protein